MGPAEVPQASSQGPIARHCCARAQRGRRWLCEQGVCDKVHAGRDLLAALAAILEGKQFVSTGLAMHSPMKLASVAATSNGT